MKTFSRNLSCAETLNAIVYLTTSLFIHLTGFLNYATVIYKELFAGSFKLTTTLLCVIDDR